MKRLVSVVLCGVLMLSLGITAMAQSLEEVHYMTDYTNLGELYADLEPEWYEALDEQEKQVLYETTMEEVLEESESDLDEQSSMRAGNGLDWDLSVDSKLKSCMTYKVTVSTAEKCTKIALKSIVYDSSNKIVDIFNNNKNNAKSANFSRTVTGLVAGGNYKVYAHITITLSSTGKNIVDSKTKTKTVR